MSKVERPRKKGGIKRIFCVISGILILLSVLVTVLPIAIPRLLECGVFRQKNSGMEPRIPEGSLFYVEPTAPEDLEEKDVIALWKGSAVTTRRVSQNRVVEGVLITKEDAVPSSIGEETPYEAVICKVVFHMPVVGYFLELYATTAGKIYAMLFAACGVMFLMLAGQIRKNR